MNQSEMLDLIDTVSEVAEILDSREKAAFWMVTKNPHLGNVVPFEMFLRGRGHKVKQFVYAMADRGDQEMK